MISTRPGLSRYLRVTPGGLLRTDAARAKAEENLEDRIRAHVTLCWLALLLARISENATGRTWPGLRRELSLIHIGTFTGPAGTFRQRTELTKAQPDILRAVESTPLPASTS